MAVPQGRRRYSPFANTVATSGLLPGYPPRPVPFPVQGVSRGSQPGTARR
jgi:hypothetical protein